MAFDLPIDSSNSKCCLSVALRSLILDHESPLEFHIKCFDRDASRGDRIWELRAIDPPDLERWVRAIDPTYSFHLHLNAPAGST